MYLKYRQKFIGKTTYTFEINEQFDLFVQNDINTQDTKQTKKLDKTSIMIKPKYGEKHHPVRKTI